MSLSVIFILLAWFFLFISDTCAISSRTWILLIRRGQNGNLLYYFNNINAIAKDLMKNTDPREDCVFYVNSYNSTREKNAAIAFATIRNTQSRNAGLPATANTLYDAFELDVAFGSAGTLMTEATAAGPETRRRYFKVTSGAYAMHCRGTVWLIAKKGVEIYHDAIWLTDEYPALIRPGSGVTVIYQIDPADVEWQQRLFDQNPNRTLDFRESFYNHQPPGARPPRDIGPLPYVFADTVDVQAKIDEYSKYPDVADGYLPAEGSTPAPQCDLSKSSQVPWNVFTGVFPQFCQATLNNALKPLDQIVDSRGNLIPPRKRTLFKRAPPPNPDTYNAYTFELGWTGGKGYCSLSCTEAFTRAANSPCGHTAGEQNIMSESGTIQAGCGTYKWRINKPPGSTPKPPSSPTVSPVKCNAADAFGKHGDINPDLQSQYIAWVCVGTALKTIRPGDAPITFETVTNGTPYNYSIRWLAGCTSTVTEMNANQPLPNDSKNTCGPLLRRTFTDCNNGGVGGYIDVGCLRYEFHP